MAQSIPLLIHQTWRDSEVPKKWRDFQQSWRHHHPDWDYRLWTDLELRQLICESYPWFLPIYDNYAEPIQRVDAARYFLMHRFGGVYVDLDFECLRPLGALLKDQQLLIGLEPAEHFAKSVVQSFGFESVACNAFLASRPGHEFWEHVFFQMIGAHQIPGPLPSTGPLMLTRSMQSFRDAAAVACLPSEILYPGTSEDAKKGLLQDAVWREKNTKDSYAIHHWSGSWIVEPSSAPTQISVPMTVLMRGRLVMDGHCVFDKIRKSRDQDLSQDRVSCLMVTSSSRLHFVKRSVACFQAQTYAARELVVVDDSQDDSLQHYIESLNNPRLRVVRLAPEGRTLGTLRNLAVSHASGRYIMQWDDDDLYHARRIETQMGVLRATGADACLLSRWKIWWPQRRRLATSKKRGWEGSILCLKEKMPLYDESRRRGEDTPAILRLASREKITFADAPWLYTYIVHGDNTTPNQQLDQHWVEATGFDWGDTYASGLRALASHLPDAVRAEVLAFADSSDEGNAQGEASSGGPPSKVGILPGPRPVVAQIPRVLVLSPVKDGAPFIESYIAGLKRLDYPPTHLSLALLESDSSDGTFDTLSVEIEGLRRHLARAELFKRDYHFRPSGHRADSHRQLQRRAILARSRNYLMTKGLRDEDWVFWLDFDVIDYPPDIIQKLLSKNKEIIVPHCVIAPGGRTFDLNTFIRTPGRDEVLRESQLGNGDGWPNENSRTLLQPDRGVGREYLEDRRDRDLVEVDAVGGTVLFVKADLHREGLVFPVAPYKNYIETEGLSFLARDMGVRSWGAPQIEVVHANR